MTNDTCFIPFCSPKGEALVKGTNIKYKADPDASIELFKLLKRFEQTGKTLVYSFKMVAEDGTMMLVGKDDPAFTVTIKNKEGFRACMSLHELLIVEAFMDENIDIDGDLIKATVCFQDLFSDQNFILKNWRIIKPLLIGREKCNPEWIAKHYDSNNLQLLAIENSYDTYTQGMYESDDECMDTAAERKLAFAFEHLKLKTGDTVLDIGSGWGGMIRYCADRGVKPTGITLSKHQKKYVDELIEKRAYDAEVLYQDFFTYCPEKKYDAVSLMGVIEDLSDYKRVMLKLPDLVKPGGRVYLDFANDSVNFASTRSFITKYIWPGTFRLVYMPEFIDAIRQSKLEIIGIYDDRHNYHLWAKKCYEKIQLNKEEFVSKSSEYLYRMFLTLYAGTSAAFIKPDYQCGASRVVLELPLDRNEILFK